ncbi:MAG: hypothetical protein HY308_14220 [Gammaproteobacteria bacterium]|nr:hypothetical protein [Gammaproteobacteria bacterium]
MLGGTTANVTVQLPGGGSANLTIAISADGMLVIRLPVDASIDQSQNQIVALGLVAAKESFGAAIDNVKGVVIERVQ